MKDVINLFVKNYCKQKYSQSNKGYITNI